MQACVPYACAFKCLRVRACLQPRPRPGMRMPEPHLQTLGTHPLGIVAPNWASLGLPFQRQCFDSHRGPHLGTTWGAFFSSWTGLSPYSRLFGLAKSPPPRAPFSRLKHPPQFCLSRAGHHGARPDPYPKREVGVRAQARALRFETLELGFRLAWLGIKNTFLTGASVASFCPTSPFHLANC